MKQDLAIDSAELSGLKLCGAGSIAEPRGSWPSWGPDKAKGKRPSRSTVSTGLAHDVAGGQGCVWRLVVTKGESFKRAVREQAQASGQRYTQARVQMRPDEAGGRRVANEAQPLPVLLAHVLLDINRQFERAGAAIGEEPSLLVWADLLRVIPDVGILLTDLPAAARISRRAVKAWLTLEGQGWLRVDASGPRAKLVTLTEQGRERRDRWGELIAATERTWSARVGNTRGLRAGLEALVGQLDLELPHYPMVYGASDLRALGGRAIAAKQGPPRIPPHGSDWVPVVRTDNENVVRLPLHALVSQALMAFTIDYEEEASFSMAMAAMLGRAMPTRAVPVESLPRVLGVNGSGKSGLERHGFVRVSGDREAGLTDVGLRVRDAYQPVLASVTRSWRARFGDDLVNGLVTSLADVEDHLSGDLPDQVIVRYASGLVFRDVSFAVDRELDNRR